MPPEFQAMFSRMFDDAPQNEWSDVEKVIREEFGKSPEEVFGSQMERTARASASVAQVHWARLADGREVAVKVQKREIAQQVGWDLWAFKYVLVEEFVRECMLTCGQSGHEDLYEMVRPSSIFSRPIHHRTSHAGDRFRERSE